MWHSQNTKEAALRAAERLVKSAEAAGRPLTPDERSLAKQLLETAQDAKDSAAIVDQIDAMRGGGWDGKTSRSFGFGDALVAAIPPGGVFGKSIFQVDVAPTWALKAPTIPAIGDLARNEPTIVPMGYDRRWLYPNLVRQDLGNALSIQDFTQTARTVVGTVERSAVAATDKATLNTTTTLANEAVKQEAIVLDAIPVALLESVNGLREWFQAEGEFQIQKAIDTHVFAQIVAAAPPFGNTGTGLVAQVRNAVAAMRAEGANPDVLVLNATDAAALDLTADAGGYIFPTRDTGVSSPLWDLKVVERTSAAGKRRPTSWIRRCWACCISARPEWISTPTPVWVAPTLSATWSIFGSSRPCCTTSGTRRALAGSRRADGEGQGSGVVRTRRFRARTALCTGRATSSTSTTTTPWPSGSLLGGSSRFRANRPARVRAPETPQRPAWLVSAGGPLRSNERHHSHA